MKLGLKKKTGGGEKKAKRKAGGGNGLAGVKTFFAEHVEKLVLGAIALVALMLVFKGFSQERLETGPDAVQAAVSGAQSRIDSPTWADVKRQRAPEPDSFKERASLDVIDVDLAAYKHKVPFHPRLQERSKQRIDPEILAPFDLEVKSGYGGLSVKGRGDAIDSALGGRNQVGRSWAQSTSGRSRVALGGSYDSRFFVAITGLVPYRQQFDGFQNAFQDTIGYNVERDVPRYLSLNVERAEVQPDGSLSEWQILDTNQAMNIEPQELWEGRSNELASKEYLIDGLVMSIPPIVRRDLSKWAVHSTVPLAVINSAANRRGRSNEESARTERERRSRMRDRDSRNEEEAMVDNTEVAQPAITVDSAMLRFFDLSVESGKSYRYRLQVVIDDPNNPLVDGVSPPDPETCETDVLVRLKEASEPYRRSPWSEPTETITVPRGSAVLASSAMTPKSLKGGPNGRVPLRRRVYDEPSIDLMALIWDANQTRDVPVMLNVRRGSVLNGIARDIEVGDPSLQRILPLRRFNYRTDAIVLDVHGGVPIDGLASPGALLVWKDGRIEVHGEFDDLSSFDNNKVPVDEDALREEAELRRQGEADESREGGDRLRGEGQARRRRNNNRERSSDPGDPGGRGGDGQGQGRGDGSGAGRGDGSGGGRGGL